MEEQVEEVQNDTTEGAVLEGVELPTAESAETQEEVSQESAQVESDAEVDAPPVEEEMAGITKAEWAKTQEMLTQQEQFIKERGNEVGDLRQQINVLDQRRQQLSKTDDELNDLYIDNAAQAIREQNELSQVDAEARVIQQLIDKGNILQIDPEFESKKDEIAEMMIEDGYRSTDVQRFKTDPYWVDSNVLLSYSKQVSGKRELSALKEKVDALSKKPGEVAKNIEAAAKGGVTLNASTGGSTGGDVVVTSDMVESMTSEQRQHFIKTGEVLIN